MHQHSPAPHLRGAGGRRRVNHRDGSRTLGPPQKQSTPVGFHQQGLLNPGSDLLSRDLSSDYHRRADVSLPGSEWDRVGPSGYDHQASVSLLTACPAVICRITFFPPLASGLGAA